MRTCAYSLSFLPFSLVSLGLLSAAGCVSPAANEAPVDQVDQVGQSVIGGKLAVDRLVADTPAQTLAHQVEALLDGPASACKNCHGITRSVVQTWGQAMLKVESDCIVKSGLTPLQRVDCLRVDPTSGTSAFSAHKLGLYTTGAAQPQFAKLFTAAYGPVEGPAQYATFRQKVAMPLGGPPLTALDFARVKGWVLRDMPSIDEVFDEPPPDPQCDESSTPELLAHITKMKTQGWGARLADLSTPMFGCGAATNPLDCLGTLTDVTAGFGEPVTAQKIRQLMAQPLVSHYWVGFGLNSSARVVDLAKPNPPIAIAASYDPFFFPSNDGFAFAGTLSDGSLRVCRQSLLADVAGSPSPSISLGESKCTALGQAVYQSIGSALDGLRYFVTVGSHENDDGGHEIDSPLPAQFGNNSTTTFIPMENNGIAYNVGPSVNVKMPREGDAMLSPSSLLVAMRFARSNGQTGYRVRLVKAQGAGQNLTVQTPLAAEVCVAGSKAGFSFDERFMVTHQYVDHNDPDQANLPIGSSNIVLVDLKTGQKARLTKMAAGRFALFPHFRADGWLYFLVRDMNANTEYVLATDAALRMPQ
jgi:hypothetical protein